MTKNNSQDVEGAGIGRRRFLNSAAAIGITSVGLAACQESSNTTAAPAAASGPANAAAPVANAHVGGAGSAEVKPGQLDTHYALWSSGHTGDARVLGIPSGRELLRIPCFVPDALIGWGLTNESKAVMGTRADGSLRYTVGDTHHVHGSYKDGIYDGKYAWINDKINSRLARLRLDYMVCDKITKIPNVQGFHGIFPDRRDPVDPAIDYTTRVFCGQEFHVPMPNKGAHLEDPKQYHCLFTCVDAETMDVRWQARIDGNCDLVATSFDGKLAASNQYNTENGALYPDMMAAERDACLFFNIARIEQAIKDGKFTTIGDSKVPVVDCTVEANKDPATALSVRVSTPKNPHGVNASPDGKYFICSGKLSPTATVIELQKVLDWFDGKLEDIDKAIVAEPEIGLGPLHTTFDGKGNAYTTLFLDSQVVKWNIDKAIQKHAGDKEINPIVHKLDVMYQPGHINATNAETKEADGIWMAVGNKFSKDRFLPVGPMHPENDQLIDITGEQMVLVHDNAVRPEPHDFIIFKRDWLHPKQVYELDEHPQATKDTDSAGVTRNGNKVTVRMISFAPSYTPIEFKVKVGDEVTLFLTNIDKVEDLAHGFALPEYNIQFVVNPQETKSVTFKIDQPGVFWYYCTNFCHALHLEMRGRMIVEA
ncbi:TAT-dependent nitrous-oxide reductase [Ottowia sp.]|uniref:TAT-dependent nitrous-oxide reductase n=1 Tax=Ottowia sp. TaxID=1898956 RepID=UPI003A8A54C1